MTQIVPTILADTPQDFAARLERVKPFAKRLHIDVTDGVFAPHQTLNLAQVYAPEGVRLDLHLMLEDPTTQLETALSLNPQLIIFHAESAGDLAGLIQHVKSLGIAPGLALLPDTAVPDAAALIKLVDHVMIFTGTLGSNGGAFQAQCLDKISSVKVLNPTAEIGVDGGVNAANAHSVIQAGADVLNVGSFIHQAADPLVAYEQLDAIATGVFK